MLEIIWWGVLLGHWGHLLWHYRLCARGYTRLPMADGPTARRAVSVVIPARNEARDIGMTLASLRDQRDVDLDIVVVDDRSEDATAAIVAREAAQDSRIRLLTAPPLPPGWLGKPHALACGVAVTAHPWLLFMDADVRLAPLTIASALAELDRRQADLLTLIPHSLFGGFWERAVQPVMASLLLWGVSFAKVNDPADRQSLGVGAFILVRREIYDRVGGHAAIRNRIIDDYALAETVKRSGGRLWLADGGEWLTIRMYHSLAELWHGWSKNLYAGLTLPLWVPLGRREYYLGEGRPIAMLTAMIGFLSATYVISPLAPLLAGSADFPLLAWTVCVISLGWAGSLSRRLGMSPFWGLAFPIGAVLVIAMACRSVWLARRHRTVLWRGRAYRL